MILSIQLFALVILNRRLVMTELLDKYGPTCSVAELVTQLNRLYHEKEAE